jgi:hypothetical protein
MVPKDKGKAVKGKKGGERDASKLSAHELEWARLRDNCAFFPLGYASLEGTNKLRGAIATDEHGNGATIVTPAGP